MIIWCVACVVSALERMHAQLLLLRSIAAPRLAIDEGGYVRVLDLAHAKYLDGRPAARTRSAARPSTCRPRR